MSIYSNYSFLGRVKLPSGTTYALIDVDGRGMLAPDFSTSASYTGNDYVIYNSDLYKCNVSTFGPAAWDSTKWTKVTVSSELKGIWSALTGGIHYRGYTTTSLYEGATTNPIIVDGNSYTAVAGDMVIETPPAYATGVAYTAGQYVVKSDVIYIILESISAANNTQFSDLVTRAATNKPEFIYSGSIWNEIGSLNPSGLGSLAYKNNASGSYVKPTGAGSVSVTTVSKTTKSLDIETSGNTQEVNTGYSLSGTTTFNTDAIKAASLTGTTTFATSGVVASVDGDCLTFASAGTGTVDISTTAASTGTVGISSAGTATVLKSSATLKEVASGGDVDFVSDVTIDNENRTVSVGTTTDTVTVQ